MDYNMFGVGSYWADPDTEFEPEPVPITVPVPTPNIENPVVAIVQKKEREIPILDTKREDYHITKEERKQIIKHAAIASMGMKSTDPKDYRTHLVGSSHSDISLLTAIESDPVRNKIFRSVHARIESYINIQYTDIICSFFVRYLKLRTPGRFREIEYLADDAEKERDNIGHLIGLDVKNVMKYLQSENTFNSRRARQLLEDSLRLITQSRIKRRPNEAAIPPDDLRIIVRSIENPNPNQDTTNVSTIKTNYFLTFKTALANWFHLESTKSERLSQHGVDHCIVQRLYDRKMIASLFFYGLIYHIDRGSSERIRNEIIYRIAI